MRKQIDAYLDQLIAAHHLGDPTQLPLGTLFGLPSMNELIQKSIHTLGYHTKQAVLTISMIFAAVCLAHLSSMLRPVSTFGSSITPGSSVLDRVSTHFPYVSLTFDVGYDADELRSILNILQTHQIRATFFITQIWFDHYPELTRFIVEQGHDLGNMGDDFLRMSGEPRAELEEDLRTLHQQVEALTGYEMSLFRPPYGEYDASLLQAAVSLGYVSVRGEIDSLDWKEYGSEAVCREILDNPMLSAGSLIRCHSSSKSMVEALDELLSELTKIGLEAVPLSVLLENAQT